MDELNNAAQSLKAAQTRVTEVLVQMSVYVDGKAAEGDTLAAYLPDELEQARTAMRAEGVAASAMIGDAN